MVRSHGPEWIHDERAQKLYGGLLSSLADADAETLKGAGLTAWKRDATQALHAHKARESLAMRKERRELEGGGLFSDALGKVAKFATGGLKKAQKFAEEKLPEGKARNFVTGPRKGYLDNPSRMLDQYGDWTVTGLTVRRDPIQQMLNTLLNAVSLGKWNKARRDFQMDKLYHLSLTVRIAKDGQVKDLMIEKRPHIAIAPQSASNSKTEIAQLAAPSPPVTLQAFMDRAQQAAGDRFFSYDAFDNNCQDFILGVLRANHVAMSEEASKFVKQDISNVIKEQPKYVQKVAQGVTNLGHRVNEVFGGGGMEGEDAEEDDSDESETLEGGDMVPWTPTEPPRQFAPVAVPYATTTYTADRSRAAVEDSYDEYFAARLKGKGRSNMDVLGQTTTGVKGGVGRSSKLSVEPGRVSSSGILADSQPGIARKSMQDLEFLTPPSNPEWNPYVFMNAGGSSGRVESFGTAPFKSGLQARASHS